MTLDFTSVPKQILLDEGMYEVTIKKVEKKVSNSGKDMLFVVFEEVNTKSAIFENYVLTPDALWKLEELLRAAGFDTEGIIDFDEQSLVGMMFKAKIVQREYNGNTTNSIKKIFTA